MERFALAPDLLRLVEELDEHRHLRAQDLRLHRREAYVSSPNAVMKMIGVCSELRRERMSEAVSKPSRPGMLTSRRMTANSSFKRQRRASRPDGASTGVTGRSARIARSAKRCAALSSTSSNFALGSLT